MSNEKISNIISLIKELNVMDLCSLVKQIDEEFDLPQQQTVVQTASVETKEAAEEKSTFDVVLGVVEEGAKIAAIKVLRKHTSLGLKELQEKVTALINKSEASFTVATGLAKTVAEEMAQEFKDAKLSVTIK